MSSLRDAFWQILGRVISALGGFLVVKLMAPYLGTLRYGDYGTLIKYFATWSALADFGMYVLAIKAVSMSLNKTETYGKFLFLRFVTIAIVYSVALAIAYTIPSYTQNPYLVWGLPLGMLFSASFMAAGILQIPLQVSGQMQHVTIGLTLARIAQIALLITIVVLFPTLSFSGQPSQETLIVFCLVMVSVVLSGVVQGIYVLWKGNRTIPIRLIADRSFAREMVSKNWRFGLAYFFSSFHTLAVAIILSWFYPTAAGLDYVGMWMLAMGLVELLLIIPSSIGNSLLGRLRHDESDLRKFGNMLTLMLWIGIGVSLNFALFGHYFIGFLGGSDFLASAGKIGADTILPRLGIVLILNFIKQTCNYIFVSRDKQNSLLVINGIGIGVGISVGLWLISQYGVVGGIITQVLLEMLFVAGSLLIAFKYGVLPRIHGSIVGMMCILAGIFLWVGLSFPSLQSSRLLMLVLNILRGGIFLLPMKKIAQSM